MQNSYDNQEKLARQNSCCASGNLEYAGFWVRMAAYMIDSVVVFAGLLIVRLIFAGISLAGGGAITGTDILFHYSLKDIVLYALKVLYFIAFTYLHHPNEFLCAGLLAQLVEQRTLNPLVAGSTPSQPTTWMLSSVWLEHLPYKQRVIGSSPIASTISEVT